MQVETPQDLISAYSNQVTWLMSRVEKLKQQGVDTSDPTYAAVQDELNWATKAFERIREVVSIPKGKWVQVTHSKIRNLRNKVGLVTYVNTDRGYASVSFDAGTHSHALSLKNLVIVDMPVPSSTRIPSAGMTIRFKGDPEDYVAVNWSSESVYVEPMSSVTGGKDLWYRTDTRKWRKREEIETIEGQVPL